MDIADQYCQDKAARSGSSFYYSFLFLPTEQRKAINALYAFCREVDDIVDEYTDLNIAQQKLGWWKDELDRIFTDTAEHPIGHALQVAKTRYALPKHLFEEILQGMNMDLTFQGYQTFDDLRVYCHCVASAPGLLAAKIFGFQDHKTLEYAKNLGVAFQLVNIIRDVGEDFDRGRVYLPESELKEFSVSLTDLLEKNNSPEFKALMQYQAVRAKQYYTQAMNILPAVDRSNQRVGIIMAEIYFALLKEIERANWQVLHQKISLTPLRKLWIAWKTARQISKNAQSH
jgi:15-cis-phytoene synthase